MLVASVLHDEATGAATVFALNRSTDQPMELTVELRNMGPRRLEEAHELHHDDLKAVNSKESPEAVAPVRHGFVAVEDGTLRAILKPLSWNVFATGAASQPAH